MRTVSVNRNIEILLPDFSWVPAAPARNAMRLRKKRLRSTEITNTTNNFMTVQASDLSIGKK